MHSVMIYAEIAIIITIADTLVSDCDDNVYIMDTSHHRKRDKDTEKLNKIKRIQGVGII